MYIPLPTYGKNPYHIVNVFPLFQFWHNSCSSFKWKTIIGSVLAHVALILGTWLNNIKNLELKGYWVTFHCINLMKKLGYPFKSLWVIVKISIKHDSTWMEFLSLLFFKEHLLNEKMSFLIYIDYWYLYLSPHFCERKSSRWTNIYTTSTFTFLSKREMSNVDSLPWFSIRMSTI